MAALYPDSCTVMLWLLAPPDLYSWCLSMVELAEDLPETEATEVRISEGLLIFSTGFLFLSLVMLSSATIFSVSLVMSV